MDQTLTLVPQIYLAGGLAFFAYLLGLAMQPVSVSTGKLLLRPLVRAERGNELPLTKVRRTLSRWVEDRVDVSRYRAPVLDMVTSVYVKAGIPSLMSLHYPLEKILERLDGSAAQLWKAHPDQYQEYDRLRAERNFRRGVWLPLIGIAVAISLQLNWWLGALVIVVAVLGSLTLLYQSWILDFRRTVLLANALFQGLIEDSELKSMVKLLASLTLPSQWRLRESLRCAITAVAFAKMGDFESSSELTEEAAETVMDDAALNFDSSAPARDLNSAERQVINRLAEEVRVVFRVNQETDEISVFDARLDQLVALGFR